MDQGTNCFQYRRVEGGFFKAGRIPAGFRSKFQPVNTPPDDLLSAMDVPGYPAEVAAAVPAHKSFRKRIFAGKSTTVGLGFLGVGGLFASSPGEFLLDVS